MAEMNIQNSYKNKYFSILGDSISTFEGYSQPKYAEFYDLARKYSFGVITFADTWWGKVIDYLGGELLVNNSISGSMVCEKKGYGTVGSGCGDVRTAALGMDDQAPDVIMVYMGTNDWGGGKNIVPAENEEGDLLIFSVAYRAMLEKLKRNYPEAEIWCFTLGVSTKKNDPGYVFPHCFGGRHIEEYCAEIRACAEEYGCRLIDLYLNPEHFDTMDGFHPNTEGMQTIADAVIAQLEGSWS